MARRRRGEAFEAAISRIVAPRLHEVGYEPAESEPERKGLSLAFEKPLPDGAIAGIRFDRRSADGRPVGYGFTVWLRRWRLSGTGEGYEDYLDSPLDFVLRVFFALEVENSWWAPRDATDRATSLSQALTLLEKYGIPWLEDPQSRNPGYIHPERRIEFRVTVSRVVSGALGPLGYAPTSEDLPMWVSFRKQLPEKRYAHVQFNQLSIPTRDSLAFTVHLVRNQSLYGHGLDPVTMKLYEVSNSLTNVLWTDYGMREYPSNTYVWEYKDPAELERQLEDATDKLVRYGIEWVETSESMWVRAVRSFDNEHPEEGAEV
jgi:hypothetical protein